MKIKIVEETLSGVGPVIMEINDNGKISYMKAVSKEIAQSMIDLIEGDNENEN